MVCFVWDQPLAMYDKYVEVSPKDVIWDNIDVRPPFLRIFLAVCMLMRECVVGRRVRDALPLRDVVGGQRRAHPAVVRARRGRGHAQ